MLAIKNTLSTDRIIQNIKQNVPFECMISDGSFTIRVNKYIPFVCLAIHDGHQLRQELKEKCLLSEEERLFEEDPYTGVFISTFPIVITANDSRFEYDLNRDLENCIYDTAWGKRVWKDELTENEKKISRKKYRDFYKVLDALIVQLRKRFKSCLVYDIHSFNYLRRSEDHVPVFNVGTENIDNLKYRSQVMSWMKELSKIEIPNVTVSVEENAVFYGRGYLLKHITEKFKNVLVLATEVKKIYCNEEELDFYPAVIDYITEGMKKAIMNNAYFFIKHNTSFPVKKKNTLLAASLDESIKKIDKQLFRIVRDFELLNFVNPVNYNREKYLFFKSNFQRNPSFKYSQLTINPFELKRKLFNIPVEHITDISIQQMYKDTINAYSDKIELLATLGTEDFLYSSLKYFGEPREQDISNANFLLSAKKIPIDQETENISVDQALEIFEEKNKEFGFSYKTEVSDKIISKALVNNNKKRLVLKKGAKFSEIKLNSLFYHEVGIHMLTTINSLEQTLKIFHLGLPIYTLTQEGLAILSEYLTGNLNLRRLKILALRVIAINHMIREYNFRKTFLMLIEDHQLDHDTAFDLTARTYRGGGFTKDYLYLRGFRDILNVYKSDRSIDNLFIGKTSVDYLDTINEMVDRKIVNAPKYKNLYFSKPVSDNALLSYLVDSIK